VGFEVFRCISKDRKCRSSHPLHRSIWSERIHIAIAQTRIASLGPFAAPAVSHALNRQAEESDFNSGTWGRQPFRQRGSLYPAGAGGGLALRIVLRASRDDR
jgi:hypothetical protein